MQISTSFKHALSAGAVLALLSACNGPAGTNPAFAPAGHQVKAAATHDQSKYNYVTLDDPGSSTLTEVLGLNNLGKICGFYGSPNSGFIARSPYMTLQFRKQNYPGAVDTQVTSINNSKTIAGWYLNQHGQTFGFTEWEGIWTTYQDPHTRKGSTQITEILGIESDGLGVGYYEDSTKIKHAFEVDTSTGQFHGISVPGSVDAVATGINGKGDIVGWMTVASGGTEGWLLKGGIFTLFSAHGSLETQPTALNWTDDIVGSYQDASGKTHGFLLTNPLTSQIWQQVDEPESQGKTVITGINNHHAIVGYFKDVNGHTDGFLATEMSPRRI